MLVEYIVELIDKWERQGVSENEMVKRIKRMANENSS